MRWDNLVYRDDYPLWIPAAVTRDYQRNVEATLVVVQLKPPTLRHAHTFHGEKQLPLEEEWPAAGFKNTPRSFLPSWH